jgi:hypothetical protein
MVHGKYTTCRKQGARNGVSDRCLRASSWGSWKRPNRFKQHHVACRLSVYRCIWVHTQSTVMCQTVAFVRQPDKGEPLQKTLCRLQAVQTPLHLSPNREQSAVSDSGLRENSSGSRKKADRLQATPCRLQTVHIAILHRAQCYVRPWPS